MGFDNASKRPHRFRHIEGLTTRELELVVVDRRERVITQPVHEGARCSVELFAELVDRLVGTRRQVEIDVCTFPLLGPLVCSLDEVPKGDVMAALRKKEVTGPKSLAHGKRKGQLPGANVR